MFKPWRVVTSGILSLGWATMLLSADVFLKLYLFPIALAVYAVAAMSFLWRPRRCWAAMAFGGLLVIALAPLEVTDRNYSGPPRVVPLVMGLPTQETYEAAQKGELVLGGCAVSGNEPKWVLVW